MFDGLPVWTLFICVLVVVFLAIETGHIMKRTFDRSKTENETLVSVITGSVLGLLGFVLAFTFSIVYSRYESRKELVRQEANAVKRVWLRSQFMDQANQSSTQNLLRTYVDVRLLASQAQNIEDIKKSVSQSEAIQQGLWEMGVTNAKNNSLSGLSAPYLQSINDLIDIHGHRLAIGVQDRVPPGIWISLGALLLLSMITVGYFAAIKGGKRSPSNVILAVSFSLLFVLVSALDDPFHGMFTASQQPLLEVRALMTK